VKLAQNFAPLKRRLFALSPEADVKSMLTYAKIAHRQMRPGPMCAIHPWIEPDAACRKQFHPIDGAIGALL
jgi:hypothetical protein